MRPIEINMNYRIVDPAKLEGDHLRKWFEESSEDIEYRRRYFDNLQYLEYFYPRTTENYFVDTESNVATGGASYGPVSWKLERDRKAWERREGTNWPRTDAGKNYHMHHEDPRADGGSDDWDNKGPMHPDDHRKHHMEKGDFRRWGAWSGRGKGGPVVRGFGLLGIIPNITGVFSDRIRTDSVDNFVSDMLGQPSQEDMRKSIEEYQKMIDPKWKPGDQLRT